MGELHLEIYVERLRREYNVNYTTGKPRVAFRETITQKAEFNCTHKKQTGGASQYAKVIGYIEPMKRNPETGKDVEFENVIIGAIIPNNFIPAVERVNKWFCINHLFFFIDFLSFARGSLKPWRRGHYLPSLAVVLF